MSDSKPVFGSEQGPENTDRLFKNDTFMQVGSSCSRCYGSDGNHQKMSNGKQCPNNN